MCGGAGTRLWPVSRESMPKQFVPLVGEQSTFQQLLGLLRGDPIFGRPIVITHSDFRFIVAEQMRECGVEGDIVLEPVRRDSAMAVAVASIIAAQRDPSATVLVLAADHVVRDHAAFVQACREAIAAAAEGRIVTFGVTPTFPATKYGYIRPGVRAQRRGGVRGRSVCRKARRSNRWPLHRRKLSLEQRQLRLSRRRDAQRTRAIRT